MRSLTVLIIFAPLVLCRTPYDLETERRMDHMKEIIELNKLTEEYNILKKEYKNPLQSLKKVTTDDVSFYVYNREDKNGEHVPFEHAGDITSYSSFNTNLDTVFVIHGWHNDYLSPIVKLVEAALLGFEDANIIPVYWDKLARDLYIQCHAAVPQVGEIVGEFIDTLSKSYNYPMDRITLIGHSLGAHVAGFAGKTTNGKISSIIALDPAGPLYLQHSNESRLCPSDAQYVVAIHTCAKLLGVNYPLAHADFWPNGGYNQAGCGVDLVGTCSHSRAYQYYAESVTSNKFVARKCDSYDNYENGNCKANEKEVMGGPTVNTRIIGNFYLNTNEESPYAQGDTNL